MATVKPWQIAITFAHFFRRREGGARRLICQDCLDLPSPAPRLESVFGLIERFGPERRILIVWVWLPAAIPQVQTGNPDCEGASEGQEGGSGWVAVGGDFDPTGAKA